MKRRSILKGVILLPALKDIIFNKSLKEEETVKNLVGLDKYQQLCFPDLTLIEIGDMKFRGEVNVRIEREVMEVTQKEGLWAYNVCGASCVKVECWGLIAYEDTLRFIINKKGTLFLDNTKREKVSIYYKNNKHLEFNSFITIANCCEDDDYGLTFDFVLVSDGPVTKSINA